VPNTLVLVNALGLNGLVLTAKFARQLTYTRVLSAVQTAVVRAFGETNCVTVLMALPYAHTFHAHPI
jgi:hypothetical protein